MPVEGSEAGLFMKFAAELLKPTIAGHEKPHCARRMPLQTSRKSMPDKSASRKTNLLSSHRNSVLKLFGPTQLREISPGFFEAPLRVAC